MGRPAPFFQCAAPKVNLEPASPRSKVAAAFPPPACKGRARLPLRAVRGKESPQLFTHTERTAPPIGARTARPPFRAPRFSILPVGLVLLTSGPLRPPRPPSSTSPSPFAIHPQIHQSNHPPRTSNLSEITERLLHSHSLPTHERTTAPPHWRADASSALLCYPCPDPRLRPPFRAPRFSVLPVGLVLLVRSTLRPPCPPCPPSSTSHSAFAIHPQIHQSTHPRTWPA